MPTTDVLIVGAGPTGLALAAQVTAFGATARIVDRRRSPRRESRALVVQPRTLEVLRPVGVTPALVACGDDDAAARMHLRGREVVVGLRDDGLRDTPYPFLLALRQAETEVVLRDHLRQGGVDIEWGAEYLSHHEDRSGVTVRLRSADGGEHDVRAGYVAGCDGADSVVRRTAGIAYPGASYRQSVLLADVDLDGPLPVEPLQAFVGLRGGLVLYAGGEHAAWRLIVIREGRARAAGPLDADGVRALVASVTGGVVRVRRVAWLSDIPQQRRLAATFRSGRVVLAGDAAHVHTPAGARGMNTGLQDACNLGWRLALVARGVAVERMLDSYDAERRRAARVSLWLTHVIFFGEAADHPAVRWLRGALAPFVVPLAVRLPWARRFALRTIGQLRVRYGRGAMTIEGRPRLWRGPRAGARLPDAPLARDGAACRLHDVLGTPGFHLLLCGPPAAWPASVLARQYAGLLTVDVISPEPGRGVLHDPGGAVLRRLGAGATAQYLVRPDGHVGFRCAGTDLAAVTRSLAVWLPRWSSVTGALSTDGATAADRPGRR